MKAKTRNFMLGMGSVMDLAPVRDLRVLGQRRSPAERMASHFLNAGSALSAACQVYQADAEAPAAETKNA